MLNNQNPQQSGTLVSQVVPLILSLAILASMTVLLIVGRIDYVESIPFLAVVAGLWGVNVAYHAASPVQQQMLSQLISQAQQPPVLPPVVIHNIMPSSVAQPVPVPDVAPVPVTP